MRIDAVILRIELLNDVLKTIPELNQMPASDAPKPGVSCIPTATYRLQLHAGLNLERVMELVPYLKSLGISHLYTSSILTAKPGSTHGYDVCDHGQLNPEIGTETQLRDLSQLLKRNGMGLILDLVPNHMSIGPTNQWWSDVLENGPSSSYAGYFDIVWNDHPREHLRGKVLLPILGVPYGEAIESQLFQVVFVEGAFFLHISHQRLPIDVRTYGFLLDPIVERDLPRFGEDGAELQSIVTAIRNLPERTTSDTARNAEGRSEIAVIKRRLKQFAAQNPECRETIVRRMSEVSNDPVQLDGLIEKQAYRPCYWQVASDEINYRRFFDVNDLAAICTEKEDVFRDVHRTVFRWLEEGLIDGLRIDHPDGLYDPKRYLDQLQNQAKSLGMSHLFVVVEKILGVGEQLRADWQADGTTGYDFIQAINGLFVNRDAEPVMTALFERFSEHELSFAETVYRCKFLILQSSMTSELHVLAEYWDRLAQSDRSTRDLTRNGLRHALREVLSSFPVYRTYIDGTIADTDRAIVLRAVRSARRRNSLLSKALFDFIRDTLLLRDPKSGPATAEYRPAQLHCVSRFQQLSSPVMAKGAEDTAFYIYNRLISLNEVGSEPSHFGHPPEDVHAFLQARRPGNLSPLSTHDTKRSDDVRARINALSEIPDEWEKCVRRWSHWNRPHRKEIEEGQFVPDGNEEYLLYQTLVGTWPLDNDWDRADYVRRIGQFMIKAVREAKVHSSWINPIPEYDDALLKFVNSILDPQQSGEFLKDFQHFQQSTRRAGMVNSLGQTLIQCLAPGIPDVYQGTELWNFRLVDPDNRQMVDFDQCEKLLAETDRLTLSQLIENPDDGRIKLHIISKTLRLRREDPELFERGDYRPVKVIGSHGDNVFAFIRSVNGRAVLAVVSRLTNAPSAFQETSFGTFRWKDVSLELPQEFYEGVWINVLDGGKQHEMKTRSFVSDLLRTLPIGLFRYSSHSAT